MTDILARIANCIERGKINVSSPYPPDMLGQDGADELTRSALDQGVPPDRIMSDALVLGMRAIGEKFSAGEAFIPDILMSAKAMNAAMEHLKPYFDSGVVKPRGVFVIGTVTGDLHDIGKNLVGMVVKGGGWRVIDLGVNVPVDKFIEAVASNPGCAVGLSALLTTTMSNMKSIVEGIKSRFPNTRIIIGGAPINRDYARKIGADAYSPDPQGAVNYLNSAA